jgi:pilus assembly protein CpaB
LKRSNRVVLFFGVALAAVAFVGVLALGSMRGAAEPAPVETVQVVVAATELSLGTQLTADMLAAAERPVPQAAQSYAAPDELVGSVIRRTVPAGHVLRTTDFEAGVGPQADISASLSPGLRAMAVALDRVSGVGFLLQPGDYVDVILTMGDSDTPVAIPNPLYPGESSEPFILLDDWTNNTSVKVLVQNVQVVAVLAPPTGDSTNDMAAAAPDDQPLVAVIAVAPDQVELVRYAQQTGFVSLAMRSPQDRTSGTVVTPGVTLRELIEQHGVLPPLPVQP